MKKKGVVYRMTMFAGLFMIMVQVAGESNYSRFWKSLRNKEIQDEKSLNKKIDDMEEDGEGQDNEESKSPMTSREKYKQERLNKIKESRDKESK